MDSQSRPGTQADVSSLNLHAVPCIQAIIRACLAGPVPPVWAGGPSIPNPKLEGYAVMKSRLLLLTLSLAPASLWAAGNVPPDRVVLPTGVVPTHYALSITPDAAAQTFKGAVQIDIDVKRDTNQIELNSADITFDKVSLTGMKEAPQVSFDADQQTVILRFDAPVKAGHHVLSISYAGQIHQQPAGFFSLDYTAADGSQKRALFTQFENSDARRFLPSWDEPGIKATFSLTADVPKGEMAVSNMPQQGKPTPLKGGLERVRFQTSPKMSSYLLFFGLGDFERISQKVGKTTVGVIVKRGDTAKAKFALDAAVHLLPYYNRYFGVDFPLPKLDLIAAPGQSQFFSAMENWGAIFYFEGAVLIDPKVSTIGDEQGVYITIAHEMSHQWFGDLVTMDWWDNLWLNEGFASWMENKATDQFHRDWKLWLVDISEKEAALAVDARAGTHPIVTPIRDVLQANEAFDTITYQKGESVIHMLEDYVGDDAFRAGVRTYMKAHAYGNTESDDLWRELAKATPLPVTQVAHDFTLQAGVPLIRVATTPTGLRLSQERFYAAGPDAADTTAWHVPVMVGVNGSILWKGTVSRGAPADVAVPAGSVAIVNAGQTGYFRTLYDADSFAKVAAGFSTLSDPADQLALLNDSFALGNDGYASLSHFTQLAAQITPDTEPMVTLSAIGSLQYLDYLYEGLPGQPAFKAWGRKLLEPVLAKVGWDPKPGEAPTVTLMRNNLLGLLSQLNDQAVVDEANKRFAAYLKDPNSLSGDTLQNVLNIVAFHADADTWDKLHALARDSKSSLEKLKYYPLLGAAHDETVAKKALDLVGGDEAPITVRPTILDVLAGYHPLMAADYVIANKDAFDKFLEPDSRVRYLPQLLVGAEDPAVQAKLDAYAADHIPADARGDVTKTDAAISERVTIRTRHLPDVDAWLAAHGN